MTDSSPSKEQVCDRIRTIADRFLTKGDMAVEIDCLQQDVSRYNSGREVLVGEIDTLKLKNQQVTLERDAMLEDIAALRMAERMNVETISNFQKRITELEARIELLMTNE